MNPAAIGNALSEALIPVMIATIAVVAVIRRVAVYEVLIEGAKEGFSTAVRIIPYLVAILVAIGMFRASGAMALLSRLLAPITTRIGLPAELVPVAIMRPLSGSGALALVTEAMKTHGPDSFIGRLASTMYGSSETTFYVLAVYFGSVGIARTRHAVVAGLAGDLAGLAAAIIFCRLLFGHP
jgi:spore maturation protein B